ncbi:alpha/beta hydrolase [Asticcacaulis machinosus]|uniref:Alpha/beta hydrolase n=1 Tax=Asticcacaulis machinosus TaxID=2984211 RepID=A0ABT5HN31_9CAUL|nr:alpha/beta hydrolase [Asticcacaulis machinosus]MDC7677662.1 alpha/beta hydrolase [Asticcacaulis machinosus]
MRASHLRRLFLKRVLSLPPAVLRFLAGGGVVHVEGRTLDAQIQFLARTYLGRQSQTPLSVSGISLEAAREDWCETAAHLTAPLDGRVRIEPVGQTGLGDNGHLSAPIRGLLIRPLTIAPDAPLIVFFHDGGGVLGGAELSKSFATVLATETKSPVYLPDYRLAPEHRFPAALEDAQAAYDWAVANAASLGVMTGAVAVGGQSIGASLATRLCLDLKREFKPLPVAQLLISPLLDLADDMMAASAYAKSWPVSAADIAAMIDHYGGAGIDLTAPQISPLRETVVVGQPKALIVAGGLDPIAHQAEAWTRRLMETRTKVIYRRYDTLPHGFPLFTDVVDEARSAALDIAQNWLKLLA